MNGVTRRFIIKSIDQMQHSMFPIFPLIQLSSNNIAVQSTAALASFKFDTEKNGKITTIDNDMPIITLTDLEYPTYL